MRNHSGKPYGFYAIYLRQNTHSQYLLFLNVDSLVLLLGISGSVRSVYPAIFIMPPSIYFSNSIFLSDIYYRFYQFLFLTI